ncbi:protein FAR1-RELATED SEQUENCE 5-like [Carya illinoinensis]|uniref:protein FAR1-RELATED SEQUENCE 5-like n=1 Tax=Carya illinoinensis TaxID=32201 RepID=UPI001C71E301|nr:protein FAR1-RELATED SEQUENCE 5-like [Carya illinoinensis]
MSISRDNVEIFDSANFSANEVEIIEDLDVEVEEEKSLPNEPNTGSSSYVEPYVGLQFDDVEDAHTCYKAFSRRTGFSIRTNHTRLAKEDRSLIGVEYVCSREGFRRWNLKSKNRVRPETVETKIGCKAMMTIRKDGEKCVVSKRQFLGEGDAQSLYTSFLENERNNPGFVYSIQVDENGSMGNYFWADARSRAAYQYFGDVVTFDITYLTNRYKMPFVPFTRVNHHHQSVMFECALLINETVESYTWLLKTWLEAMLGRTPTTIITDDDKAMAMAIAEELPNTTHKLCLLHILQKVPEHLTRVYNKYPQFQQDFYHCIHETLTIEEFEFEWTEILLKYKLEDNSWLQGLYARRAKWVLAYLRGIFCAGMSTTQCSESMNKFFKSFVRSSTMVHDFVHQYDKALNAFYLSEKEKDVKTKTTKPIMRTCFKVKEEAAKIYTRKSFIHFQEELFQSQRYKASKTREEDGRKIYLVTLDGKESPAYEVTIGREKLNVSCTCCQFEFIGFLCCHNLHILGKKSMMNIILQSYVLERWTINAKSCVIHGIYGDGGPADTIPTGFVMKHHLIRQFYEVAKMRSQHMREPSSTIFDIDSQPDSISTAFDMNMPETYATAFDMSQDPIMSQDQDFGASWNFHASQNH